MMILRYCVYAVLAVVSLFRILVLTPFVVVWLGAELVDDVETMERMDYWIERFGG